MKRAFLGWIFFIAASAFGAEKSKSMQEMARFDFRGINVAQVVQLIYGEALNDAYVIDPDVLTDQRNVSFRYEGKDRDLRAFVRTFLDLLGFEVSRRDEIDFIQRKQAKEVIPEEKDVFVYRPKHRSGSYLVDLLSPLFKGQFTARRAIRAIAGDKSPQGIAPPGSAAASIDRESDAIVFAGSAAEVKLLTKMLEQIDIASGSVIVRGVLYEVQTASTDGSAFSLALSLLGGKLGVNFGSKKSLGNSVSFANTTIDTVLSSLSADSRFTVKSIPTVRVQSGEIGRFTVGQDVPVLGAVTYAGNAGAPVRSVEYRSSGVIFELLPTVREESVELKVMQQMSNFVATDTGVNDTPTLIKRELKTSLSLADGELMMIGGLAENKETNARSGLSFIPDFLHTKSGDKTNTEILLVLQVIKM